MEAGTVARLDGQRTPAKMSYLQQGPFGTTRARLPRRSCSSQGRARTGRSPRHVSASMLAPSKSRIPAEFLSPALHIAAEGASPMTTLQIFAEGKGDVLTADPDGYRHWMRDHNNRARVPTL